VIGARAGQDSRMRLCSGTGRNRAFLHAKSAHWLFAPYLAVEYAIDHPRGSERLGPVTGQTRGGGAGRSAGTTGARLRGHTRIHESHRSNGRLWFDARFQGPCGGHDLYWINASQFGATSKTDFLISARLWARGEQMSVMVTTLLVILLCMSAGTFVSQAQYRRDKWCARVRPKESGEF
jgi:hypothetical protein